MKVIFAGTPEFAKVALTALHAAGFTIPLVLTQPDRPAGRGMRLQASAVKQFAAAHNIAVAQPASLQLKGTHAKNAAEIHALLKATPHDVMVVAAYGLILPQSVLDIAPLGCLNIHASLLPRWRGAAPIQRAIEAGDTETGITIMQMDAGLDTGPMLALKTLPITSDDTAASLHDKLALLGGKMIVEVLQKMTQETLIATPQPAIGTYAAKITKDEAILDFTQPAPVLAQKIRAFNPFPGASARLGDVHIKFWSAIAVESTPCSPGQVIAADTQNGIVVACGHGALRIMELQKQGAKRLLAEEFLKGFSLTGGIFS